VIEIQSSPVRFILGKHLSLGVIADDPFVDEAANVQALRPEWTVWHDYVNDKLDVTCAVVYLDATSQCDGVVGDWTLALGHLRWRWHSTQVCKPCSKLLWYKSGDDSMGKILFANPQLRFNLTK
jgi:hypothetical protein